MLFVPSTDTASCPPILNILLDHLYSSPQPCEFGFTPLDSSLESPTSLFTKVSSPDINFAALGVSITHLGPITATIREHWRDTRPSLNASLALLLFCPDTHSAWCDRKSLLSQSPTQSPSQSSSQSPSYYSRLLGELSLLDLINTNSSKASSAWEHRRWVVRHLLPLTADPAALLASERTSMRTLYTKTPKHYYVWTHLVHLNNLSPPSSTIVKEEIEVTLTHFTGNPSDHSAVAYMAHLIALLPTPAQLTTTLDMMARFRALASQLPTMVTIPRALRYPTLVYLRECGDEEFANMIQDLGMKENCRGAMGECVVWVAFELMKADQPRGEGHVRRLFETARRWCEEESSRPMYSFMKEVDFGQHVQSVADVGRDNAEFIVQEEAKGWRDEVGCLKKIFEEGEHRETVRKCLGGRWEGVLTKYGRREWAFEDIEEVVQRLGGPHLKPSSILERLEQGLAAAGFGVATLVSNLKE